MSRYIHDKSDLTKFIWKKCINKCTEHEYAEIPDYFYLESCHGILTGRSELDYLMKGEDGSLYIMRKKVFEQIMQKIL